MPIDGISPKALSQPGSANAAEHRLSPANAGVANVAGTVATVGNTVADSLGESGFLAEVKNRLFHQDASSGTPLPGGPSVKAGSSGLAKLLEDALKAKDAAGDDDQKRAALEKGLQQAAKLEAESVEGKSR